jgi:hypothetical protein
VLCVVCVCVCVSIFLFRLTIINYQQQHLSECRILLAQIEGLLITKMLSDKQKQLGNKHGAIGQVLVYFY